MPEGSVACESFTVIPIDFYLHTKKKYYLQGYLDNCASKIIDKRMIDDLDKNHFETDEY